jgi:predicted O-linked N-acetylglucosamine transferase (SPINDLY family)
LPGAYLTVEQKAHIKTTNKLKSTKVGNNTPHLLSMNAKLTIVVASLTLIAIALLLCLQNTNSERVNSPSLLQALDTKSPSGPNKTVIKNEHEDQKYDEIMAANANVRTPKFQKFLVDALLKSREPKYQSLFEAWQLDQPSRKLILECVYEREYSQKEALRKLEIQGRTGRTEFWVETETNKKLAEFQLEKILGKERAKEFEALESTMTAEMQIQAKQLINSKLND